MMDEFKDEAPTQPEVTESLERTMERLREESSRRPTVRLKALAHPDQETP